MSDEVFGFGFQASSLFGCVIRGARCEIPHRATRITDPGFHIPLLATRLPYRVFRISRHHDQVTDRTEGLPSGTGTIISIKNDWTQIFAFDK